MMRTTNKVGKLSAIAGLAIFIGLVAGLGALAQEGTGQGHVGASQGMMDHQPMGPDSMGPGMMNQSGMGHGKDKSGSMMQRAGAMGSMSPVIIYVQPGGQVVVNASGGMQHGMYDGMMHHGMMNSGVMGQGMMESSATTSQSSSTAAYMDAYRQMHMAMAQPLTGNADIDFVQGMIPHHEGAIAMARILIEHGSDPALKKMAESIIAAQSEEITTLKAWLAARQ